MRARGNGKMVGERWGMEGGEEAGEVGVGVWGYIGIECVYTFVG